MTMTPIRRRDESGVVTIEFALIAIILFSLLFGIIEFGLSFSRYQVYQGAAREGARAAAVRGDLTTIAEHVEDAAQPFDPPTSLTVKVGGSTVSGPGPFCTNTTIGQSVRVEWDQDFEAIALPFLPDLSFDLTVWGAFRCE